MSTQTQSPGTMADDATVGTISYSWFQPDNAKTEGGNSATLSNYSKTGTTHYLKATNFGFSIPVGATINGILVEIKQKSSASATENIISIVKADGTIGGTNKSTGATLPSTLAYTSYGSSSDLWDETWDTDKINDVDFGVVFSTNMPTTYFSTSVDHIRITVYYTEPSMTTTNTAKTKIAHISLPELVSPEKSSSEITPITLVWKIPEDYLGRLVSCEIQIATDENFENIECDLASFRNNFEYWNGSEWLIYPQDGVESQYYGNQARVITTLSNGEKNWRVRGLVKSNN